MPSKLGFFDEIQQDVERDNSLIVFGRGLGMATTLANFVSRTVQPTKLIIGLNISRVCAIELIWPAIRQSLLETQPANPALLIPRFINADYSIKDRKQVYELGGFLVITSNVLVHDFLHSTIPAERIAGIVIFSADGVREGTNDHFALKLFRTHNRDGFVKAFSEAPNRIAGGFHDLEKLMRRLYLSRVCLWPRFHKSIKNSLRDHQPDLIDLTVDLSPKMAALIRTLRQVAQLILEDLRSATKSIDVSEVYENDAEGIRRLKSNFDRILKRQVDGVSDNLGWRVRAFVSDLVTVRMLLRDVLQFTSVLFYKKFMTLRETSPRSHNWLLRKEAQTALLIARSRVWTKKSLESNAASITRTVGNKANSSDTSKGLESGNDGRFCAVAAFEESPKWRAISSILNEIQGDLKSVGAAANLGRVLIFVKEKRLVHEIQSIMSGGGGGGSGGELYLKNQFQTAFPAMAERIKQDAELLNKSREKYRQTTIPRDGDSEGQKADGYNCVSKRAPAVSLAHVPKKRSRRGWQPEKSVILDITADLESATAEEFEPISMLDGANVEESKIESLVWCTEWIDYQGRAMRIMNEFRPSFIILYTSDVSLVRQSELYKASHPGLPVRLYILTHADYTEEEVLNNYVKSEKQSFKNLIRERASMATHCDQEGRRGDEEAFLTQTLAGLPGESKLSMLDSRRNEANNRKNHNERKKIIVDTRELRSKLPMLLHQADINIVPITLEVSDFVLSKKIGVERKTIPDLTGSFISGRLFSQAEALCQHYQFPCLLIELDPKSPLSLVAKFGGVRAEMSATCLTSKIVLLAQHFPDLRILWAQGAMDAVKLFLSIKENEGEPDEKLAASFGVDSAQAAENEFNPGPRALLRSLPGIDGKNIYNVMRKVNNVAELTQLTEEQMASVLGCAEKARLLHEFVNKEESSN